MKTISFSGTDTIKAGWFLFLCMTAMALVIFVNPNTARSTDRLLVTDTSGAANVFVATDGNYSCGADQSRSGAAENNRRA